MKVYLQEEIVLKTLDDVSALACRLPPFALVQVRRIRVVDDCTYLVSIYCFNDDVDLSYFDD